MHNNENQQFAVATVIGDVVIEPRGRKKVFIGFYEGNIPKPDFFIQSEPDMRKFITARLEKKEENGEYTLTYLLQNASDTACRVSIVETELATIIA